MKRLEITLLIIMVLIVLGMIRFLPKPEIFRIKSIQSLSDQAKETKTSQVPTQAPTQPKRTTASGVNVEYEEIGSISYETTLWTKETINNRFAEDYVVAARGLKVDFEKFNEYFKKSVAFKILDLNNEEIEIEPTEVVVDENAGGTTVYSGRIVDRMAEVIPENRDFNLFFLDGKLQAGRIKTNSSTYEFFPANNGVVMVQLSPNAKFD